jgi:hypothetical protein
MASDKSEKHIARKLEGKLTNGSGAVNDDADIKIHGFLIECKRRDTIGDKIVFNIEFWEKLRKQSVKCNREPLYIWEVHGNQYCVTYLDTIREMACFMSDEIMIGTVHYNTVTNVTIKVEDYIDSYNHIVSKGKIPVISFRHEMIDFGIVDLDSFKRFIDKKKEIMNWRKDGE